MTMGWHTVMEFAPSLVGCCIFSDYSSDLIKRSRECVINVPTVDLASKVVGIGNCSGRDVDKFAKFKLTRSRRQGQCAADRGVLRQSRMQAGRRQPGGGINFFILEVVKAHVGDRPRYPRTIHYRGDGVFMVSGRHINLRSNSKRKTFDRRGGRRQQMSIVGRIGTRRRQPSVDLC